MSSYSSAGNSRGYDGRTSRSSLQGMAAAVSGPDSMSSFKTVNSQDSMGPLSNVAVGNTQSKDYEYRYTGYRSSGLTPRNNYDSNSSLIPCTDSLSSDSSFVPVESLPSRESSIAPSSRNNEFNGSAYRGLRASTSAGMPSSNSAALGVLSDERMCGIGSNRHDDPSRYSNFRDRLGSENSGYDSSSRNYPMGPDVSKAVLGTSSSSNYSARDSQVRYSSGGESRARYANGEFQSRYAEGSTGERSYVSGRSEQVSAARVSDTPRYREGTGLGIGNAQSELRLDGSGSARYLGGGRPRYNSESRPEDGGLNSSSSSVLGSGDSTSVTGGLSSGDRSHFNGPSSRLNRRATDSVFSSSHLPSYSDSHSRLNSSDHYRPSVFNSSTTSSQGTLLESLPTRKIRHVQVLWDKKLGHGAYGAVYQARCDHVLLCAGKVLHPILKSNLNDPKSPSNRFVAEREWMSSLRHPNIVQYLGCHVEPDNSLVLLMELMDESLTHFLARVPAPLPYRTQLRICHDVTMALAYLHSNEIIHRDLSSNNVLLIGDARAKVGDFGMAKMFSSCRANATACPGTEQYMPPEVINEPDKAHTFAIDSFSFGVLMVQIVTLKYPNPGNRSKPSSIGSGREIVREAERRQQHLDEMGGHALKETTLLCLSDVAEVRPSSTDLCTTLEAFREQVDPRAIEGRGSRLSNWSEFDSGYSHSRRDSGFNNYGGSDDPKELKRKIAELERQVTHLQVFRRHSTGDMTKEKASQKRQEYSNSSGTMASTSSNPSFQSLDSIEEDERNTASLPTTLPSALQEISPQMTSLSVSSSELDAHDSTVVNRPRSIKFDVEVEEVTSDHAIKVEAFLTSIESGTTTNLLVEPPSFIQVTKKFTCKIQYTPRVRGKHRITLHANGKEECSKDVFINAPKKLIQVNRKMSFTKRIHCLTVREDFLYCTVPERGEFCLLNRDTAEELVPVKCNRTLRGIAVGPDNNLYVTGDHVVQKYSPEGWKIIASHGGDRPVEYKSPAGIGIFNNSVFVCDTGNGRIVVCDLSLNKVRIIPHLSRQKQEPVNIRSPEDVAFDEAGRMFIADSAWKRILICALDGNYLGEIIGDSRDKTNLQNPKAVAVREDKVYVTDHGANCIAIFDITSGKRVHKIPVNGDPLGLSFDEQGYIYTSCKSGNKHFIVVY